MPGGAMGGSGMSAAMIRVFGNDRPFTAKSDIKMESGGEETLSMTMDIAFSDGVFRGELDLNNVKGAQFPPQAMAQIKMLGMDKMVNVVRHEKKTMTLIYPTLKAYVVMPLPAGEAADKEPKIEKTELGKETVDGQACVKNKLIITGDQGTKHEVTVWNAVDLKEFPVQMKFNESGSEITMKFKEIKQGKPSPTLFEPGTDFQKYENIQKLMMEKMMAPGKN